MNKSFYASFIGIFTVLILTTVTIISDGPGDGRHDTPGLIAMDMPAGGPLKADDKSPKTDHVVVDISASPSVEPEVIVATALIHQATAKTTPSLKRPSSWSNFSRKVSKKGKRLATRSKELVQLGNDKLILTMNTLAKHIEELVTQNKKLVAQHEEIKKNQPGTIKKACKAVALWLLTTTGKVAFCTAALWVLWKAGLLYPLVKAAAIFVKEVGLITADATISGFAPVAAPAFVVATVNGYEKVVSFVGGGIASAANYVGSFFW